MINIAIHWSNIWHDSSGLLFKIEPWKSNFKVIGQVINVDYHPVAWYPLISYQSLKYSWNKVILTFDPENQNTMPSHGWDQPTRLNTRSKIVSDSHTVYSMPISPPVPEIWLLKNLTLTIQGHGYGWGQRPKSHSGYNNISTNIFLISCQCSMPSYIMTLRTAQSSMLLHCLLANIFIITSPFLHVSTCLICNFFETASFFSSISRTVCQIPKAQTRSTNWYQHNTSHVHNKVRQSDFVYAISEGPEQFIYNSGRYSILSNRSMCV